VVGTALKASTVQQRTTQAFGSLQKLSMARGTF
jgi:hypothetical protein